MKPMIPPDRTATDNDRIKKQRLRLREVGLPDKIGPSTAELFNRNSQIRNTVGFDLIADPDIKVVPLSRPKRQATPVSPPPVRPEGSVPSSIGDAVSAIVGAPPVVRAPSSLRPPLFRQDIKARSDEDFSPISGRSTGIPDYIADIPARFPPPIASDTMFGKSAPTPTLPRSSNPVLARLQDVAEKIGITNMSAEQLDRLTRQDLTGSSTRKEALDSGLTIQQLQIMGLARATLEGKISQDVLANSVAPLPTPEELGGSNATAAGVTAAAGLKGFLRAFTFPLTDIAAPLAERFGGPTVSRLGRTVGEFANADVARGLRTPQSPLEAIAPVVAESAGPLLAFLATGGASGLSRAGSRAATQFIAPNVAARAGSRLVRGALRQVAKAIPGAGRVASGIKGVVEGAGALTGGAVGGISAFRATDLLKDFIGNKITLAQLTKESLRTVPEFGNSLLRLGEDGVKLISKLKETGDLTPEEQDRLSGSIGTAAMAAFMVASAVRGARASRKSGAKSSFFDDFKNVVNPVSVNEPSLKPGEVRRLGPPPATKGLLEGIPEMDTVQRAVAVRGRRVVEGTATEQDINVLKSLLIQGGIRPADAEATINEIASGEIPVARVAAGVNVSALSERPGRPPPEKPIAGRLPPAKAIAPGRVLFLRNEIRRRFRDATNKGTSRRRMNALKSLLIRGGFEGQEADAAVRGVLSGRIPLGDVIDRVGKKRTPVVETPEPAPRKRLENLRKLLEGPQHGRVPRVSRPAGPKQPEPGKPIITPPPSTPSVGETGTRVDLRRPRPTAARRPRRAPRLVPKKLQGTTEINSRADFIKAAEELQANPIAEGRIPVLRSNALLRAIGSEQGRSGVDASRILRRLREKEITPQQAADMIGRFKNVQEQPQGIQQSKAAGPVEGGQRKPSADIRPVRPESVQRPAAAPTGEAGGGKGGRQPTPVGRGPEAGPQPKAGSARGGEIEFAERASLEADLAKLSRLKGNAANIRNTSIRPTKRREFKQESNRLRTELSKKFDPSKISQVEQGKLIIDSVESLAGIRKDAPRIDETQHIVPVQKPTALGNAIAKASVVSPTSTRRKQGTGRGKKTTAVSGKEIEKQIKAELAAERAAEAPVRRTGTTGIRQAQTLEEAADVILADRIADIRKSKRGGKENEIKRLQKSREQANVQFRVLRKFEKERDTKGLRHAIDNTQGIMDALGQSEEGLRILSAIDEVHRRDMERITIDENTTLFVQKGLKKLTLRRRGSEGGEGKKGTLSVAGAVKAMQPTKHKPTKKKAGIRRPSFSTLPSSPIKKKGRSEMLNKIETLRPATNDKETRYLINGVLVEEQRAAATDGRRLHVLALPKGHGVQIGVHLNEGRVKVHGFPKIDDIIPEKSGKNVFDVDILGQLRGLVRARVLTSEESPGVALVKNPDGTLGYSSYAPEIGQAEINVKPGGEAIGGANPDFLIDAFEFVARNGEKRARLQFPESNKPIVIEGGDAKAIVMPVKLPKAPPQKADVAPDTIEHEQEKPPTARFRVDPIGDPGFVPFFASRPTAVDVALGRASAKLEGAVRATGRLIEGSARIVSDYALVDLVKRAALSGSGSTRFRLAVLARRLLNNAALIRGAIAPTKIKLLKRGGAMPFTKHGKVNSEFQEQVGIVNLKEKIDGKDASFGFTKLERVMNGMMPESVLSDLGRETLGFLKKFTIETGDVLVDVGAMQIDAAGKVTKFTTQKDGKVFLRLFAPSWYDAMYAGRGPLYETIVRSVAEANKKHGMTLKRSREIHQDIHRGMTNQIKGGPSRRFNVERVRQIREYPTFVRLDGQNYGLMRTNLFDYVQSLAERTARRGGFISTFGQPEIAGKMGLEDKVAKLRGDYIEQGGKLDRFDDLMKSLNGIPIERPLADPGTTVYAFGRGLVDFTRFIKGLNITGTGIYNTFEPLGNIQAFGGIKDFVDSAKRLSLDFRATTDAMEELGLIVVDRANKSYDPTRPVQSVLRMISDSVIQGIGLQFQMNLPTRLAPVVGLNMVRRLRGGKGTRGDRFMLDSLHYSRGEVNQFMAGKASRELEYSLVSRLSENLTGFPRDATTENRAQQQRLLKQLFPFQTYAFRVLRRFADTSRTFLKSTYAAAKRGDVKTVGGNVFRYNRFLMGQAAAGAISDITTSLLMGGVPGLKQRLTEITSDPERFGKYLLNSFLFQVVAGPFGGFIRQMQRGDVSTSRDMLEHTYYGFLAFQAADAILGQGAYRDLDGFSRLAKAVTRMTPIFKFAGGTMAMFGVATEENKANVARRAFFNWTHTRPSEGRFFPGDAQKEEDYLEFRGHIRRAVRAVQRRENMDVVNEHVQAALNVDGRLPKDVASALRNRQFLRGLTAEEVGLKRGKDGKFPKGSLRRALTEESWQAILAHDALLESWAMAAVGISTPSVSPILEGLRRDAAGGKGKTKEAVSKFGVRMLLQKEGAKQLRRPESAPQRSLLKSLEARRKKAG